MSKAASIAEEAQAEKLQGRELQMEIGVLTV